MLQDVHVKSWTVGPGSFTLPGQAMQFFQGLLQRYPTFSAKGFFLCCLGLCGPPGYGSITDVAIGLAIRIHSGIIPTIAVFRSAFERIKTLGSDSQDTGVYTSATGFNVDHDVHALA